MVQLGRSTSFAVQRSLYLEVRPPYYMAGSMVEPAHTVQEYCVAVVSNSCAAGHGADVMSVDWHPRKSLLASGSKDNQQPVKLWDPKAGQSVATMLVRHNQEGLFQGGACALIVSSFRVICLTVEFPNLLLICVSPTSFLK